MNANSLTMNVVENFLAHKTYTLGYKFETYSLERNRDEWHIVTLSPEEYSKIASLFERYAENDIHEHLDDVFDADTVDYLSMGDELTAIDLDNPCRLYEFGLHSMLMDGSMHHGKYCLSLNDADYKKLLMLMLENQSLNYNALEYADNALYHRLKDLIDSTQTDDYFFEATSPFLVTFDEAQKDVESILSDHPEWRKGYFAGYSIFDEVYRQPKYYFCTVTVCHGDVPTKIDDVKGVLHGTLKGIMEHIPAVALHSSHYTYLQELLLDSDGNKKEWGKYALDNKLTVKIPEQRLSYHFQFFDSDINVDVDRIVSTVNLVYDGDDMLGEGIPFKIVDVFTRDSDNEDNNQGRLAFPSKEYYVNAL
ncbi:MAG: hypothetical protein NC339_04205 [Muribaculaceae bacterium]|nr:hypothetical protein [Muribaculaceae bacterium]